MKLCASSICWVHDPVDVVCKKAKAAGFDAVELLTFPNEIWSCHGDLRQVKAADYHRMLSDHGLTLAGLHLGAIMTPSEERRRVLTDYCKRAVEFAVQTGCSLIVEGGPGRENEPVEPFMKSLEELEPLLAGTPVRIGLENHYMNWIQFIQDYEWIFDRIDSPRIGMTLDTGHFTSANVDPAEVARRFTAKVFHVHIKDHVGTRSVALGTGQTNNVGVARILKAAGYTGYLSQELEVEDKANADHYAAEGIHYLRKLMEA